MFLSEIAVSLLVRLWVEIHKERKPESRRYCQPPCEAVSWNATVSALIACWMPSASLWGCELKYNNILKLYQRHRQPPCEAVSWNSFVLSISSASAFVSLLVRLWVEILFSFFESLQESVSLLVRLWVEIVNNRYCSHNFPSASLWGCELKCNTWIYILI